MTATGPEFVPSADEQAAEILSFLRDAEAIDLAADITVEDIEPNVDPDKPLSVNLRRIRRSIDFDADAGPGTDTDADADTQR